MNLIEMWQQMGWVAKAIAVVLFFMSMWSFGVAIERIYTFIAGAEAVEAVRAAGGQAPQGRPPEGRDRGVHQEGYRYSHLAKVVLAGLQEYQFQQESGQGMSREDLWTPCAAPFSAPRR